VAPIIDVDLTRTSVFLDFDGTITTVDADVHSARSPGTAEWRAIDNEFRRGEIGSRVCLLDTWDLLEPDEATMRVGVPRGGDRSRHARAPRGAPAAGADVMVVSDGFGFYAARCAPAWVCRC
jgi:hypothetical protein